MLPATSAHERRSGAARARRRLEPHPCAAARPPLAKSVLELVVVQLPHHRRGAEGEEARGAAEAAHVLQNLLRRGVRALVLAPSVRRATRSMESGARNVERGERNAENVGGECGSWRAGRGATTMKTSITTRYEARRTTHEVRPTPTINTRTHRACRTEACHNHPRQAGTLANNDVGKLKLKVTPRLTSRTKHLVPEEVGGGGDEILAPYSSSCNFAALACGTPTARRNSGANYLRRPATSIHFSQVQPNLGRLGLDLANGEHHRRKSPGASCNTARNLPEHGDRVWFGHVSNADRRIWA